MLQKMRITLSEIFLINQHFFENNFYCCVYLWELTKHSFGKYNYYFSCLLKG